MTLDQIRIFLAVAEHQHVTKAATVLNLTQSTVSSAIAALETRHAVTLFNRIGRRIELSADGRAFLPLARNLMAAARNADDILSDLSTMRSGSLSIFASQTIASFWLPPRIVAFNEAYPAVELHLQIGNTADSVQAVVDGKVDLGLIEGETSEPKLHQKIIAQDDVVIIVGRAHPWASQPITSEQDLDKSSWVLREKGSGTRSTFEAAVGAMGYDWSALPIAFELPSNEALCAAVEASKLASAVSISAARTRLDTGALVAMPLTIGRRVFRVVTHQERTVSRATRAFFELIEREPRPSLSEVERD